MSSSITTPPIKNKKKVGNLTKVFCTSGPNSAVLARTGDELSHGQAQNGVNFDFEVKFDREGQGQSPLKTIGILIKVFYTFGLNLAILAWMGSELSRGQASDWSTDWHTHTDTHTHAGDDNTRRPKLDWGKNDTFNNHSHFYGSNHMPLRDMEVILQLYFFLSLI